MITTESPPTLFQRAADMQQLLTNRGIQSYFIGGMAEQVYARRTKHPPKSKQKDIDLLVVLGTPEESEPVMDAAMEELDACQDFDPVTWKYSVLANPFFRRMHTVRDNIRVELWCALAKPPHQAEFHYAPYDDVPPLTLELLPHRVDGVQVVTIDSLVMMRSIHHALLAKFLRENPCHTEVSDREDEAYKGLMTLLSIRSSLRRKPQPLSHAALKHTARFPFRLV